MLALSEKPRHRVLRGQRIDVSVVQRDQAIRDVPAFNRQFEPAVQPEQLLQRFPVLIFSSHQMNVVRGTPGDRRRFLDRGVLGLRPAYLRDLADYNRALVQRNRMLRDGGRGGERDAWNDRFVTLGARLMVARQALAKRLSASLKTHAGDLLPAGWEVSVEYRPDARGWNDAPGASEALRARAAAVAVAEERAGYSLFGPQRDDVRVFGGGKDLTRYGSGGQQRSALLALKMTRMEMMRESRGEAPLLLVDDIDSDLDDATAGRLLRRVERYQAFLTTCRQDSRDRYAAAATVFRVREGSVIALERERADVPADGER